MSSSSTSAEPGLGRPNDPPLLILTSLASGPKHGYAMTQDIDAFAGVTLSPGSLYGAITRLEQRGMIEPLTSADRRKPYRLTSSGRDALATSVVELQRVVAEATQRLGRVGPRATRPSAVPGLAGGVA